MSISASYSIAVKCNLCLKFGPPVRYDHGRYQHIPGDPNHRNEAYIRSINMEAEKKATEEGFFLLENPDYIPVEGRPQDAYQTSRHICPVCVSDLAGQMIVKRVNKKSK